jgi:hypothetical protein
MLFVVRDYNIPNNDIGDIRVYLSNNDKICVDILNLHDDGVALMYIKYPLNIQLYDIITTILNEITNELSLTNLFIKTDTYQDIVSLDEFTENSIFSDRWGHFIPFTRESVKFLEEYESDRDIDDKRYIIRGEILENGEFIYDKPIKSNHCYYK